MPMFLIVHKTREDILKWGFYLINAGVIIIFAAAFFQQVPVFIDVVAFVLIFGGLVMFLMFNYDVFSHRMRKKLDIGMKLSAIGFAMLVFSILSFIATYFGNPALGLPPGRIEIISGMLLIYGFFTGLILGQTYKTLPFIIWLYNYQAVVGRQKTPLPGDLYSTRLATIHMYSFMVSIVLFVLGLLFSQKFIVLFGAVAMLLTTLVYGVNVYRMIFHKKQLLK